MNSQIGVRVWPRHTAAIAAHVQPNLRVRARSTIKYIPSNTGISPSQDCCATCTKGSFKFRVDVLDRNSCNTKPRFDEIVPPVSKA